MLDTVFGLPTHALVVHAVVILVPLSAVGGVLVAGVNRLAVRFSSLVAVAAVLCVPAVLVATNSGERLEERVNRSLAGPGASREAELMEQHTALGDSLLPWVITLAVGALGFAVITWLRRKPEGERPAWLEKRRAWLEVGRWVAAAVVLVGAVISVYYVVRIGHLGAEAAWTDVVNS